MLSNKFVRAILKKHDYEKTVKFLEINTHQKSFFRRVADLINAHSDLNNTEKKGGKTVD